MAFGIVKWFNNHKGFGFIESSEIGQDVFAHFSQVDMVGFKTLQQGASVMYEPIEGPRGWMAKNIKVIAAPASPDNVAEPQVNTLDGVDRPRLPAPCRCSMVRSHR